MLPCQVDILTVGGGFGSREVKSGCGEIVGVPRGGDLVYSDMGGGVEGVLLQVLHCELPKTCSIIKGGGKACKHSCIKEFCQV